MPDLTPALNQLLTAQHASPIPPRQSRRPCTETADEFLKEAYRIYSHIHSLLEYLHTIRHAYLSTTTTASQRRTPHTSHSTHQRTVSKPQTNLTDTDRDAIDSSTALVLRDLSSSISTLSSVESIRQETETNILRKRYGHGAASALLFRWASGAALSDSPEEESNAGKSAEQIAAEEKARSIHTVREGVLWFLRRGLEDAASVQRGMVEKRIERVREKEKSVLYKSWVKPVKDTSTPTATGGFDAHARSPKSAKAGPTSSYGPMSQSMLPIPDAAVLSESDTAQIESQLSREQLQLFAEENDSMLRHYEDTLGKVQNAEKSLLEISSLQQTLVSHLATQDEYVSQLVTDAESTQTNVGRGNRELKRATERHSTAQVVFWGTVGLCTGLVVWDLVF